MTLHEDSLAIARCFAQSRCGPLLAFWAARPGPFGHERARSLALFLVLKGEKENMMKNSTKDQIAGKAHEVKGAIKEKAGKVTKDPNLEAEGQDEKVAGKVQKKIGQVEKVAGQ